MNASRVTIRPTEEILEERLHDRPTGDPHEAIFRLADEILTRSGLKKPSDLRFRVARIRAGSYSVVHRVKGMGLDCVLKIYPVDLRRAIEADPDPRFATAVDCFPIAPFFSRTRERIEAVREAAASVGVDVPHVLAEGKLEDGVYYTVMSRLEGRPWRESMRRDRTFHRQLSSRMGRLLAAMHRATNAGSEEPGPSPDRLTAAYGEILHLIADHVPPILVGSQRRRWKLHCRLNRILDRFAGIDPGPWVLAHCDFHPSNLLLSEEGAIRGLIDFQISCPGPARLDFRALHRVDERAFLESYGLEADRFDDANWLGYFFEMMWEGLAVTTTMRLIHAVLGRSYWAVYSGQIEHLLNLLESDSLRRSHPGLRALRAGLHRARSHLRYSRYKCVDRVRRLAAGRQRS